MPDVNEGGRLMFDKTFGAAGRGLSNLGKKAIGGFFGGVLGWLSASLETFFRSGMGIRYYSASNAIAGFLILGLFTWFGTVLSLIGGERLNAVFGGLMDGASGPNDMGLLIATAVALAYIPLALLHLGRERTQIRLGNAPHTRFWGRSHFRFLARPIMGVFNFFADSLVFVSSPLWMSKEDRKRGGLGHVFTDRASFTKLLIEPIIGLVLAGLAWRYGATGVGTWLAFGVLGSFWRTTRAIKASNERDYDLLDSRIEGEYGKAFMEGQTEKELGYNQDVQLLPPMNYQPALSFEQIFSTSEPEDAAAAVRAIGAKMKSRYITGDVPADPPPAT